MARKSKSLPTNPPTREHQRYFARMCTGPSVLRRQGAEKMAETAREFLEECKLGTLNDCTKENYLRTINRWTKALADNFPGRGKGNWGAARKVINIFLFHCTMNTRLTRQYEIAHMRDFLEVTLDNLMIKFLKNYLIKQGKNRGVEHGVLCEWENIKSLDKQLSNKIQTIAQRVADEKECHRCDIDFYSWTANR